MSAIALGSAVVGAAGSMYSANKSAKAAKDAARMSQVDIAALDQQTRDIAKRNAIESAELERQLTPEVAQLRTDSTNQVLQQMNPSSWDSHIMGSAAQMGGSNVGPARTPLLQAAIEKAKADLAMGGKLDADTQNAVTRRGLATAGTVGGGLGLGRDIVARDLGRTSMDVQNQRLQAASQLGGQELALSQFNTDTEFNNRANLVNALQILQNSQNAQYGRAMGAAQLAHGIQQPVVGLDPASIANLTVGNSNAGSAAAANQANVAGQQSSNWMNFAGQMGGLAMMNYNRSGGGGSGSFGGAGGGTAPGLDPYNGGLSYV